MPLMRRAGATGSTSESATMRARRQRESWERVRQAASAWRSVRCTATMAQRCGAWSAGGEPSLPCSTARRQAVMRLASVAVGKRPETPAPQPRLAMRVAWAQCLRLSLIHI
eukprot:388684-Alexandrium_andersonii.AAC.1